MRRALSFLLAAPLALAACGSAQSPAPEGFALQAWTSQAVDPAAGFFDSGLAFAIVDGVHISQGPVMAIFPGPLLPNLIARRVSGAGMDAIVNAAARAGLLDGPVDLTAGIAPGSPVGHLRFTIDGQVREVLGDPSRVIQCITTPCDARPGTPEAFGAFWGLLSDLSSWIAPELGPEQPYAFERMAVLVKEPPIAEAGLPPHRMPWPLEGNMDAFGAAVANGPNRCGVVEGEPLQALVGAMRNANQLTIWTDPSGAERGLVPRPLYPGEADPCGG